MLPTLTPGPVQPRALDLPYPSPGSVPSAVSPTDCGSVPRHGHALPPTAAVHALTLHHKLRGRAKLARLARELGPVVRRARDQHQLAGEGASGLLQTSQLHPPRLLGRPWFGHRARVLRIETDWRTAGSPAIPR